RDILAFISDLERLTVVAFASTHLAFNVNVGQKVHLDFDQPTAFAVFATAAFHIETNTTCVVTTHPCSGEWSEQVAYWCQRTDGCDRVRTRGAPNRGLVNHNCLINLFQSANRLVSAGFILRVIEVSEKGTPQNVIHQSRFAAARNPGHTGETAERK